MQKTDLQLTSMLAPPSQYHLMRGLRNLPNSRSSTHKAAAMHRQGPSSQQKLIGAQVSLMLMPFAPLQVHALDVGLISEPACRC